MQSLAAFDISIAAKKREISAKLLVEKHFKCNVKRV